jgi:hypothetical protein
MGIAFGLMALVGGLAKWPWLAVVAGVLAIGGDIIGYLSGALHDGCWPTILSYALGAFIGGGILSAMGLGSAAAILGGIALAAMVGDVVGLAFGAVVSR